MARDDVGGAKKGASEGRWTLAFLDESGFSPTPVVRKTWAPVGERPVLVHNQGVWEKVSAISAVTSDRHLYFRLKEGEAIRAADVALFVRALLRHVRGPVVVVLDNAGQHHARKVTGLVDRHPRLRIEFLPGYSPDFNPDEGVWNRAKVVELGNFAPRDTAELVRRARAVLRGIQRRPIQVAQCWRQSELPLEGLSVLLNPPEDV